MLRWPLQFIVDMVPSNFIQATGNNKNMLQVIFFAILFGIAMVMLPKERLLLSKVSLMVLMILFYK